MSSNMINFILCCKKIYRESMKRGGLPSKRPFWCLKHLTRLCDYDRLKEMAGIIGKDTDTFADRLLMECIANGYSKNEGDQLQCVKYLVEEHGADIRKEEYAGRPLDFALKRGKVSIAKFLIEKGCDVNHPGHTDKPALLWVATRCWSFESLL